MKGQFLGQCNNPNAIRGDKPQDKKEVIIEDSSYSYSLDSDDAEIEEHAHRMHYGVDSELHEELKKVVKKSVKKPTKKKKSIKDKISKK